MGLKKDIEELLERGEKLAPKGGSGMSGYNGQLQPEYVSWKHESISVINELGEGAKALLKDIEDNSSPYFYQHSANHILGVLKAAKSIAERKEKDPKPSSTSTTKVSNSEDSVFIVHGRDGAILHKTARFLEKIEIKPVILFEKPGKGKTIIEKFEIFSDVAFAVILMTPDDQGKLATSDEFNPRARQNVILELGYFAGKLGRENVAVLYDESVELPSDYHGVEYIVLDTSNAWQLRLAKEMKAAGLKVDLNNVL